MSVIELSWTAKKQHKLHGVANGMLHYCAHRNLIKLTFCEDDCQKTACFIRCLMFMHITRYVSHCHWYMWQLWIVCDGGGEWQVSALWWNKAPQVGGRWDKASQVGGMGRTQEGRI